MCRALEEDIRPSPKRRRVAMLILWRRRNGPRQVAGTGAAKKTIRGNISIDRCKVHARQLKRLQETTSLRQSRLRAKQTAKRIGFRRMGRQFFTTTFDESSDQLPPEDTTAAAADAEEEEDAEDEEENEGAA
eukprot:Platyproteum_vivax@DN11550_c0_g1_i1.p1